MIEHKIGEIITLPDDKKIEVVIGGYCCDCFFDKHDGCLSLAGPCVFYERTDGKNIIYKEIKED